MLRGNGHAHDRRISTKAPRVARTSRRSCPMGIACPSLEACESPVPRLPIWMRWNARSRLSRDATLTTSV
jgi:hypothetical protein